MSNTRTALTRLEKAHRTRLKALRLKQEPPPSITLYWPCYNEPEPLERTGEQCVRLKWPEEL